MKKQSNKKNKLLLKTSLIVFACLLVDSLLFFGLYILDYKFDIFEIITQSPILSLSILYLISLALSFVLSYFVGRKISKPIREFKTAINEISSGNFDIKIDKTKSKDIDAIIEQFNNMAQELKTIETLKSDFISNVSHEFKTPLSVIISYTKALKNNNLDEQTKLEYLHIIETNAKKLSGMSENILSLSKLENQQMVLSKEEFSLDEQIRQSIVSLQPEWQKKQIEFDIDLQEAKYYGSKTLLAQVWQNLIQNAIKFSYDNSTIKISLKSDNNNLIVCISDTGIGMNAETCKHAFDKFYQGDKSHSDAGNGLGLALVKRILILHNANITVESELAKGSTFVVTF